MTHVLRTLAALALTAVAACGGSDGPTGVTPDQIAGTYSLQTVNGQSLPLTLPVGPDETITLRSGSVTLNADRSCSHQHDVAYTADGTTTSDNTPVPCTYSVNGNTIVTTDSDDGTKVTGTYSDGAITTNVEGVVSIYRKQ